MSKICTRNYKENSTLAIKKINGIDCCPLCEKPAVCHGKTTYHRALFWLLSGDTGISSEAIARHMLDYPSGRLGLPPSDVGDRGRCIRLLELIPEWIPRLNEMVQYDSKPKTDGVIINNSGISVYDNSWSKQIPLILKEGNFERNN